MIYSDLIIGDKQLKLRLDARGAVQLEKKLNKSPLSIFMKADKELPTLTELIAVLHASLQKYNKGYTEDKTFDLYDEYIEMGNTFTDFIPIVMDIFKVSGFFKEEEEEATEVIEEKKL